MAAEIIYNLLSGRSEVLQLSVQFQLSEDGRFMS